MSKELIHYKCEKCNCALALRSYLNSLYAECVNPDCDYGTIGYSRLGNLKRSLKSVNDNQQKIEKEQMVNVCDVENIIKEFELEAKEAEARHENAIDFQSLSANIDLTVFNTYSSMVYQLKKILPKEKK